MSSLRAKITDIQERIALNLAVERFDVAVNLLQNSLKELGDIANLHNLLGVTFHKQSEFTKAIVSFKRAIEINPGYIEASLNLIILYCDLGLYDLARKTEDSLSKITENKGNLPSLVMGRIANHHCETARYYKQNNLSSEAMREYEKALTIYPRMPDQILRLAELEFEDDQFEKVVIRLKDLVSSVGPSTEAFNLLGLAFYRLGETSNAEYYWVKSQELNSRDRTSKLLVKCLRDGVQQQITPKPSSGG